MNPLNSIVGTIVAGLVLAILFSLGLSRSPNIASAPIEWTIWLHVLAGITWLGLLYYFNFVQLPAVAAATADKDGPGPAAISRYVAPRALLWFRWAAVVTWLSGAAALGRMGILVPAMTFDHFTFSTASSVIGMGAWLGTIMLINVWVLIWPSQKKLLGLAPAGDAEKAAAKRLAFIASRINTALSIPMLMGMTAFAHGLPL
jgi:uncharacterized membrane protein